MQQVISVWLGLDSRRRVMAMASALVMFAAVLGISRLAITPSMALLYSGLDAGSAGEIVQSLEQTGVKFDIRQGSIFVEGSRRDELRMTLAAQGLPATSDKGYELLDSLSGFGTTAQMFDAAYWRAKEGELARTILSSPQVQSARVHISRSTTQGFRNNNPATASVSVTGSGGVFPTSHAKALRYLIASAVAGLSPEDVSVIDGRNGLVISSDDPATGVSVPNDRAAEMKENVTHLLEARVGPGNAVVEISVETETQSETITERRFDPEGRVAISSDTEENSTSSNNSRADSVTVASNLPDGDAGGNDNKSSSQNSTTRERINFEVSETTRQTQRAPGAIRRVTVAVLVNGVRTEDPTTGAVTWNQRSDEEMNTMRELVESAVGFSAERGDTVTLKSLEFETIQQAGTAAEPTAIQKLNLDVMRLAQLAILSVVAVVLGLFVFRPIFTATPAPRLPELAPPPPAAGSADPLASGDRPGLPTADGRPALTGEIDDSTFVPQSMPTRAIGRQSSGENLPLTELSTDPVRRLRQVISDRQDETINVLQSWMEEKEENA